eukprot:CAMPEP_0170159822 /NCGR_PEP_ID=MMETSP0033_2-20121228/71758_1 /TAXON_ID=195969 /ORGANISM="Dolichomastix tenuilepis, Strain CCMP3274" /LENGTH=69 /DNA_ID=CAMNT_0010397331 /DNA_START=335 /DNA_END=541 /DNA_ORIENTATION=+
MTLPPLPFASIFTIAGACPLPARLGGWSDRRHCRSRASSEPPPPMEAERRTGVDAIDASGEGGARDRRE